MLQYFRSTILPSKPAQLLIQTWLKWDRDNCPGMAASLSYYALFSLFPMLLVVLSIIGWFLEPHSGGFQVAKETAKKYLPPEVRDLVAGTVISLNENSVGAGIVGFCLLLLTASAVFGVLMAAINKIWQSPSSVSEDRSILKMILFFIFNKLLAFLLVFASALLIPLSLIANITIKIVLELVANFQSTFSFIEVDELQLTRGLQVSSSLLIVALTAGILFKILPSVYVGWQDIWLSALLTAFLVVGLQQLASNSALALGSHFLSYGVISSVMILMLWIFLTFQIFLFGCVLSYIYAHMFGSRRHRGINRRDRVQQ
jgi:membrane protein